jgi:hypothetical protein
MLDELVIPVDVEEPLILDELDIPVDDPLIPDDCEDVCDCGLFVVVPDWVGIVLVV